MSNANQHLSGRWEFQLSGQKFAAGRAHKKLQREYEEWMYLQACEGIRLQHRLPPDLASRGPAERNRVEAQSEARLEKALAAKADQYASGGYDWHGDLWRKTIGSRVGFVHLVWLLVRQFHDETPEAYLEELVVEAGPAETRALAKIVKDIVDPDPNSGTPLDAGTNDEPTNPDPAPSRSTPSSSASPST